MTNRIVPKKQYESPSIESVPATLETMARREWKMFYSTDRYREHQRKYGCKDCGYKKGEKDDS